MLRRQCTQCKRTFAASLKHFAPHKECLYGLNSRCRECLQSNLRDWKRKHSSRLAARRRELYAAKYADRHKELERIRAETYPLRVQAENMIQGVRERNKRFGVSCPEISKQFVMDWLRRQTTCECCGVSFSIGRKGCGKARPESPSIDRFDSNLPYTLDNISLLCWRCNNIKRNYTQDDLRRVADWIDLRSNQTTKFSEAA